MANNKKTPIVKKTPVAPATEAVKVDVDVQSPMKQLENENAPKVDVNTAKVDTSRKPGERVKIRMRVDHSCCIAKEFYDLKAGTLYYVPKNVKAILNRAGLLSPI